MSSSASLCLRAFEILEFGLSLYQLIRSRKWSSDWLNLHKWESVWLESLGKVCLLCAVLVSLSSLPCLPFWTGWLEDCSGGSGVFLFSVLLDSVDKFFVMLSFSKAGRKDDLILMAKLTTSRVKLQLCLRNAFQWDKDSKSLQFCPVSGKLSDLFWQVPWYRWVILKG